MTWKVLQSTTIHENHWHIYKQDEVQLESGKRITYNYLEKKQTGAIIIAQNKDKKIALLNIYRHPAEIIWQIPIEGIESGEEDIHGAIRGCKEELHLYPEKVEKIGEFYIDPGTVKQISKVYIATELEELRDNKHEEVAEEDAIKEIKWFSIEELDEMIKIGEIKDGWTISAISYYKIWKNK